MKHDREVQEEFERKKCHKYHNWKKILLWGGAGLLVLLVIFLIGFLPRHERNKKLQAQAKQREQEAPQVEVVQVKRAKSAGELTVPGTTAPLTEAFIYARANGYLRRRFVDIGDHVRRRQLLALIDAPRSGPAGGAGASC